MPALPEACRPQRTQMHSAKAAPSWPTSDGVQVRCVRSLQWRAVAQLRDGDVAQAVYQHKGDAAGRHASVCCGLVAWRPLCGEQEHGRL